MTTTSFLALLEILCGLNHPVTSPLNLLSLFTSKIGGKVNENILNIALRDNIQYTHSAFVKLLWLVH